MFVCNSLGLKCTDSESKTRLTAIFYRWRSPLAAGPASYIHKPDRPSTTQVRQQSARPVAGLVICRHSVRIPGYRKAMRPSLPRCILLSIQHFRWLHVIRPSWSQPRVAHHLGAGRKGTKCVEFCRSSCLHEIASSQRGRREGIRKSSKSKQVDTILQTLSSRNPNRRACIQIVGLTATYDASRQVRDLHNFRHSLS